MQGMTPEERFTRIENLLGATAEHLAKHAEALDRHDTQIEKQNAGIRDLIVVSRALLEFQKQTTTEINKLREAQQATDEKLHILIATVDRIIRNQKS